jgi:HTH-type transcriptional regulator, transcriptional repressor of NAD biosynthesis genes
MKKQYNNGLVLGKFMPPTIGHLFLINSAAEQCEEVFVMICSDETQPISGKLRYDWLKQIYKYRDNVTIIWCTDENPQYPHECSSIDDFYKLYWVPSVYSRIPSLDSIFTSEEYGDEFARYLSEFYPNIKHVCVDQPRKTFDISATKIRENPFKYWDFIPFVVRPYFHKDVKRIVVMGPESTGKSTLNCNLAKYFINKERDSTPNFVEEYGRLYTEQNGLDLNQEDFENIAIWHSNMIKKALSSGHKQIFVDTEAMTTKIFGEMYVKNFDSTEIDKIIKEQHFDLYLLCDIDVPSISDNTRKFDTERVTHLERIKAELETQGLNYTLISGSWDERLEKAILAVEKILIG